MEPEPTTHTVATNDLIAKWRDEQCGLVPCPDCYHLRRCADELEQSLAREAAAHEETARELAHNITRLVRNNGAEMSVEHMIAAALASVRRAALKEAADLVRGYEWDGERYAREIVDEIAADIDRMAVSPADVKQEQVKG